MMLMGGGVKGGKVYGKWPGLEVEDLFEGRDLQSGSCDDILTRCGEVDLRHAVRWTFPNRPGMWYPSRVLPVQMGRL